jgi:excisionase family DNA binding protein
MAEHLAKRAGMTESSGTLLSARAAASALGVHERTIRRAIARGELTAVKQGLAFQITPEALQRYQVRAASRMGRHTASVASRLGAPTRPVPIPLPRPAALRLSSLPVPLTGFIGRDNEIEAVANLLQEEGVRLVTLTGPGGVGKTRLALRVAEDLANAFADGIVFVELAPVRDPALVLPAIATTIGLSDIDHRPLHDSLIRALSARDLLLILDNCEQVLAAAPTIADVLSHCPHVRVLASSRAPLGITGERLWPVAPLPVPAASHPGPDFGPAVALFVERTHAVSPEFRLTAANAAPVVQICRHLEGLPLALELAGARMRLLSPAALMARLDQRLSWLTEGTCDTPARLRSLESAIAWSYDLLAPIERALFRRLAVFVGGFTIEAVEALGGPDIAEPLGALNALVAHSLVTRGEDVAGEPRFRMLETIREFAGERLRGTGEAVLMQDRHALWCLAFAEPVERELMGPHQTTWFDRVEAEHPNLRAALAWFLEQGDAERGLLLASALTWFWSSRGYFRDARHWLETFLAMPSSLLTRGHALVDAANIRHWLGDLDLAETYAEEALAICKTHDDECYTLFALRRLASLAIDRKACERAAALLVACEGVLPAAGDAWNRAYVRYLAGGLASAASNPAEAAARFAEAAAAFRALDDRGYEAAALGRQGEAMLRSGDLAGAATAYAESLSLASATGDKVWVAWALVGAAHVADAAGDTMIAARLLGGAATIQEAIGEGRLLKTALTDIAGPAFGDRSFLEAWSTGASASVDEIVAEGSAILARNSRGQPTQASSPSHRAMPLTRREEDVLRFIADGLSDKEIAFALGISRNTASNHVRAIRDKLGVQSRAAAAALAVRGQFRER